MKKNYLQEKNFIIYYMVVKIRRGFGYIKNDGENEKRGQYILTAPEIIRVLKNLELRLPVKFDKNLFKNSQSWIHKFRNSVT